MGDLVDLNQKRAKRVIKQSKKNEMLSDLGKAISQFVYSALLTLSIGFYVCMATFALAISPPFAVINKTRLWEMADERSFIRTSFAFISIVIIVFIYAVLLGLFAGEVLRLLS